MPDDSEKHHPLAIALKGRYFEHCVANEREQCPRYLKLNKHGGNYETYQYFIDTGESLICTNCKNNELPSEATYLGIASEIVKKRLRAGATIEAQTSNAQLVRDNFSSGTPASAHQIGQSGGVAQNLFGGGFYGQGNPDSPQMRTHFDPALFLPANFEAQVQMEVGILKGPHVKWVWNRRYIRDNDFLDIRRTACSVLKDLVTGPFEYLVSDVTPANFETKLRQLVVGHIQNAAQQANELNCEIIGCSEGAELDFQYGAHPLLKNKHDIPAFLEIQKAKFEELKALDVDTEE